MKLKYLLLLICETNIVSKYKEITILILFISSFVTISEYTKNNFTKNRVIENKKEEPKKQEPKKEEPKKEELKKEEPKKQEPKKEEPKKEEPKKEEPKKQEPKKNVLATLAPKIGIDLKTDDWNDVIIKNNQVNYQDVVNFIKNDIDTEDLFLYVINYNHNAKFTTNDELIKDYKNNHNLTEADKITYLINYLNINVNLSKLNNVKELILHIEQFEKLIGL